MGYETPTLEGPMELYETPMLVDVDQAAAQELIEIGCYTSGDCGPIIVY